MVYTMAHFILLIFFRIFKYFLNRQFNNEVQHLGEQKGSCYPKCLWENNIII